MVGSVVHMDLAVPKTKLMVQTTMVYGGPRVAKMV
jgi:hypothetical protein